MSDIHEMIRAEQCPCINALIFANGDLLRLEYAQNDIKILSASTVQRFFEENGAETVCNFDVMSTCQSEQYSAFAGQGSMGGDGFVYIKQRESDRLLWLLFLDNSNPFERVVIEGEHVIAHSSLNKKWTIALSDPTQISIEPV